MMASGITGAGLGLAVSRLLTELHSGTIIAESDGRGQGASFVVEFPLLASAISRATPKVAQVADRNDSEEKKRILVVDDHAPTRATLAHLLRRRGYNVMSAGTVAEAKEQASANSFDLLISDIGLPDGDGCALMEEIRTLLPGVAGIALSGYGMDNDIARSWKAGFSEHLIKPINIGKVESRCL